MVLIKKKHKFLRQEGHKRKRLADNWRKPRGVHSKLRLRRRGKAKMVSIGYKMPENVRGLLKGNVQQVLVSKPEHLKFVKKGEVAVLKKTSNKKRLEILLEAKKLNVAVLNFPKLDQKIIQIKESLSSKKIARKLKADKKAQAEAEEKKKSKMTEKQAMKEEAAKKAKEQPVEKESKPEPKTEKPKEDVKQTPEKKPKVEKKPVAKQSSATDESKISTSAKSKDLVSKSKGVAKTAEKKPAVKKKAPAKKPAKTETKPKTEAKK